MSVCFQNWLFWNQDCIALGDLSQRASVENPALWWLIRGQHPRGKEMGTCYPRNNYWRAPQGNSSASPLGTCSPSLEAPHPVRCFRDWNRWRARVRPGQEWPYAIVHSSDAQSAPSSSLTHLHTTAPDSQRTWHIKQFLPIRDLKRHSLVHST